MTTSSAPLSRAGASTYLPYIDGLRAIAVIAVIVYHLRHSWLPGGFAGVDVFFVISGFVVSASVSQWNRGGIGSFLAYFYARRLQRIAPALLACLLATSLATTLFVPPAWLSLAIDTSGLYAFFGLSNYYFATHRESYFSPIAEFNPYTHTWSLGVEEQFYLLFPLLFFAWTRGGRWRQLSIVVFAFSLIISLGDAARRAQSDPSAAFYLITTRFWELAAGVLLFQGLQALRTAPLARRGMNWLRTIGATVSLVLLGWTLATSDVRAFPYPAAVLPVLATLGLLAFLYRADARDLISRMLGSAPAVHIGKRSYSLYLWHWPVFVIMRWTCGLETDRQLVFAVIATYILADLSYRFVECPLRYSPRLRRWPRIGVVAAGLAMMAGAWWLSGSITDARSRLSLSTVVQHAPDWQPSLLPRLDDVPACFLVAKNEGEGGLFSSVYTREGCPDTPVSAPDLYAFGDSHAIAYSTLLSEDTLRTGGQSTLYHNIGCTFASLQPEREAGICPNQAESILAAIHTKAKSGDVLLLASLRLNRLGTQNAAVADETVWKSMEGEAIEQRRRTSEARTAAMLAPLADKGIHLVLEAPKPLFRAQPFRCSDWFNAGNPICRAGLGESRAALESYRQPVMQGLERLAGTVGAAIWDPLPELCDEDRCNALRDGRPLFFDGDHLSAYGNRVLYPSFAAAVAGHEAKAGSAAVPGS